MDELLAQFVVEARELTQQASDDLIALERDPDDRPRLDSAFRAIHTLKGSVGLFPWPPLQTTLHAAEDLLGAAAADGGEIEPHAVDALLAIIEWVDRCVATLTATGDLRPEAAGEAAELMRLLGGVPLPEPSSATPGAAGIPAWASDLAARNLAFAASDWIAIRYQPHAECFYDGDDPLALVATVPQIIDLRIDPARPWPVAEAFDPFRCNLVIRIFSSASLAEIETTFRLIPDQVTIVRGRAGPAREIVAPEAAPAAPVGPSTLRVEAERIDALLDIVGELYTARNGLAGTLAAARSLTGADGLVRQLRATQREFDQLLARMRAAVMDVRMVPLAQTFRRLPRIAREVSAKTGKKVELSAAGDALEADKMIVEGLYEPLLHIIRNAVDHGIEDPERRAAVGKNAIGQIRVSAHEIGGQIAIEIADDGKGIDVAAVRRRAIERRLVEPSAAATLGPEELLALVFSPGFSTAPEVSEVSGRGVGMDAIRAAIERLGGRVDLTTVEGKGTTITLRIPASLSMSNLLIVEAGGGRFGVPVAAIAETIRMATAALTPVRSGRAFVLRDRTVPYLDLSDSLGLPRSSAGDRMVLVTDIGGGPVGIGVEAIGEQVEIMMRPPSGLLAGHPFLAGTAVMGDGAVILVLDMAALVR